MNFDDHGAAINESHARNQPNAGLVEDGVADWPGVPAHKIGQRTGDVLGVGYAEDRRFGDRRPHIPRVLQELDQRRHSNMVDHKSLAGRPRRGKASFVASTIRSAQPDDRDAILEVVRAAFTRDGRDGQEELDIVEATWAAQAVPDGLELVADADGAIVGHVLGATGDLGGHEVIGVAPLGVIPERQGRGIGTALMIELLRRAEAGGWPAVVLLGRPSYYGRFGFEPSGPLDVVYPPVGPDNPHFQLARLPGFTESMTGVFTYCWER